MRDFFIDALESLIGVFVVLFGLAVVIMALAVTMGDGMGRNGPSGIGAGAAILLGGIVYLILMAGISYLGIGIYHNTKRSAEALEKLAEK